MDKNNILQTLDIIDFKSDSIKNLIKSISDDLKIDKNETLLVLDIIITKLDNIKDLIKSVGKDIE